VRLLGIDTPETKKPGYMLGCWGPEATEFAKTTMAGQRVALVPDPTQDTTDRYGRTLAYLVRSDGWDYSVEAARAGVASRTTDINRNSSGSWSTSRKPWRRSSARSRRLRGTT
jgi:endonuclease YncB( thermonuclease family)